MGTTDMEMGEMHSQDGLMFQRQEDGSVRIRLFGDGGHEGAPEVFRTTLPASSWASIVASVSARDEDHETHTEALEFHNKQKG